MAGLSQTMGQRILGALLGQEVFDRIPRIWLSLHTADPGKTGLAEAAYEGYARVEVTSRFAEVVGAVNPATGVARISRTNTIDFVFPPIAGAAITVTHWGIWAAASDSDPSKFELSYPASGPATLEVGVSPTANAGTMDVSFE